MSPRLKIGPVAVLVAVAVALGAPQPTHAAPGRKKSADIEAEDPTFVDPRKPKLPRTHRFRIGVEFLYERLSAIVDEDGDKVRYHFFPIMLDLAYQAQFLKYLMVRPAFAFGPNVANTLEAMPFIVHPKLHFGYQGAIMGVAAGYGFFSSVINRVDARSTIRNQPQQPVITGNHHIDGELSVTTRIDRGALSIIVRGGGVNGRLQHNTTTGSELPLNKRRWDFLLTANLGWYFGDGSKSRKRREERRRRRAERKGR